MATYTSVYCPSAKPFAAQSPGVYSQPAQNSIPVPPNKTSSVPQTQTASGVAG